MNSLKYSQKAVALFLLLSSAFASQAQTAQLFFTPNSGTPGQTMDVVVRSTDAIFQNGISIIDFGEGISLMKPLVVSNSLLATASIKIDPAAIPGQRNVTVKNGTETVAESINGFEVFNSGGTNNFRATLELLPAESYSLSDMDLTNPRNQPILYFTNLYNDNTTREVKILIKITTGKYGFVGTVIKDKTTLTVNQTLRLSNRDFDRFIINQPNGSDFLDIIQERGPLPPDEYEYQLLVEENGILIGGDIIKTVITNPNFNPELISPGANFTANPEKSYSPLPLFQWFGQANSFDLALYKVMNGQTPEEVTRNVPVFQIQNITGNNFVYPAYAEKLIETQMYGWQIKARVNSSKGLQLLPSEVFRFQFSSGSNTGPGVNIINKIIVSPQEIELKPGEQFQFNVQLFDLDNLPILNIKPEWKVVPFAGTVNSDGLFVAGNSTATVAVIAKYGNSQDYATVIIKGKEMPVDSDTGDWMIDAMLRQLFGLPAN